MILLTSAIYRYTNSSSERSPSQSTLHTQLLRLRHAVSHVSPSVAFAPLIAHTTHCQSCKRAGRVADGLSTTWPQLSKNPKLHPTAIFTLTLTKPGETSRAHHKQLAHLLPRLTIGPPHLSPAPYYLAAQSRRMHAVFWPHRGVSRCQRRGPPVASAAHMPSAAAHTSPVPVAALCQQPSKFCAWNHPQDALELP